MIHGQRATWTEWLGKLAKRWPSARNCLVLLGKDATPGSYEGNGVWGHGDNDLL